MAFHPNILFLLVDISPGIEVTGHILTYIYQKFKNFSNDIIVNLNDWKKKQTVVNYKN